ncbi:cytochrome ubiquinol oxidase subunit I [Catenulispora pinisilvae]|uniref:cytochrome ubiquinol oxidase subunit I n=1 Tax=Catenulispora pinisilvae TaxID=2705253 RepID=UPI001E30272C|nr:cytochrome ubiquinol oxidase subunit I [Catenulispora pinisilvae]
MLGSTLTDARVETGFSLAFHIVFAVFGVGLPWLLLFTEGRWLKTGDAVWLALTRKWSRVMAVLFAIGAVSGTVLSFEFGLLWPAFMARYGGVLGLPFTLEAFAFFAEAIFVGLYLYGWKRLSPRAHWLTLWPIAISGTLSTLFIVTANSWMNVPTGVKEVGGKVVSAEPLAPLTGPGALPESLHMLLAAIMCTGGVVAAVYAVGMLRGRRDAYHRRGFRVGLVAVLAMAPLQLVVGDLAARVVEKYQPAKLAAMEALTHTQSHAPLTLGGIYDPNTGKTRFGIEIPDGLSLLTGFRTDKTIRGLDILPAKQQPATPVVHLAFDTMVAGGMAILALAALLTVVALWRRRKGIRPLIPLTRPWLLAGALTGPAAMAAMLAGWEVTEAGRQPWIVYGRMTVRQAATTSGGIGWSLIATIIVYLGLATALLLILRRLATGAPPELGSGTESPDPQGPESDSQDPDADTDPGPDSDTRPGTGAQQPARSPELEGAAR